MKNTERLARALRDRDNPYRIGIVTGTVKTLDPLTVTIQMPIGDPITVDRVKVAARLCMGDKRQTVIATTAPAGDPIHTHTENKTEITTAARLLAVGDEVILAAAENNSLFFILDKVGDWSCRPSSPS